MVAPALLALALGTWAVTAASLSPSLSPVSPVSPSVSSPLLSLSPPNPKPHSPSIVTCAFGHLGLPGVATVTITANGSALGTTEQWGDHQDGQRGGHQDGAQGDHQDGAQGGHQDGAQGGPRAGRVTAVLTPDKEGPVQLSCSVRAAGVDKRANTTVEVYSVPQPELDVPEAALAGAELRGRCALPAGAVKDIQVRVRSASHQVRFPGGEWARPPLEFAIAVPDEEEEDGEEELELSCEAELDPFIPRRVQRRIPVRAKPRLDPRHCPGHQNWTEGEQEILECRARGRPRPLVECSKAGNSGNSSGNSLPVGIAQRARRAQAGLYRCRAWNELGSAESNVTLWVLYHDSAPLLPILLGVFIPVLTLLVLAGFYLVHHHNTKIGEYRLWKRHPPPGKGPPRPPSHPRAPNGAP